AMKRIISSNYPVGSGTHSLILSPLHTPVVSQLSFNVLDAGGQVSLGPGITSLTHHFTSIQQVSVPIDLSIISPPASVFCTVNPILLLSPVMDHTDVQPIMRPHFTRKHLTY